MYGRRYGAARSSGTILAFNPTDEEWVYDTGAMGCEAKVFQRSLRDEPLSIAARGLRPTGSKQKRIHGFCQHGR